MPRVISLDEQQELRGRLEARHGELAREIADSVDESKQRAELRCQIHDQVDEALADDLGENALTAAQRASDEFAAVDRALSRMDAGFYGICVACGNPIPLERLRAEPAAERCIDDQRRRERETVAESSSL